MNNINIEPRLVLLLKPSTYTDMSKIEEKSDCVPDFDVPRLAATLSPEKPNDEQKKIAKKVEDKYGLLQNVKFM